MRIIIAALPRRENSWLTCLFSSLYGLDWLTGREIPERPETPLFKAWVEGGGFRDGSVFHQHYDYTPEFVELVETVPARVATIIRNPYDSFVSLYYFVQAQAEVKRSRTNPSVTMIGKPIDDPEVISYLRTGFYKVLDKALGWVESDSSVVVRYEELHRDPAAELRRATGQIAPVAPETIEHAITSCEAATLRQTRKGLDETHSIRDGRRLAQPSQRRPSCRFRGVLRGSDPTTRLRGRTRPRDARGGLRLTPTWLGGEKGGVERSPARDPFNQTLRAPLGPRRCAP